MPLNHSKVREIIRNNPDDILLATNADKEIPLHIACKDDDNSNIVLDLLGYRQQQQLEAVNGIYGNTPLHVAACLGKRKIVDTILECPNSVSLLREKNKLKDTPVHSAASRGHVRYVNLLIHYRILGICMTIYNVILL